MKVDEKYFQNSSKVNQQFMNGIIYPYMFGVILRKIYRFTIRNSINKEKEKILKFKVSKY
jgi:hypothetical protein